MTDTFHTCEECDAEKHEDEGIVYPEPGIFVCDTCYGKHLDADYAAMQDHAAIHRHYPHLDHYVRMQQNDPVRFYTLCKDDPGRL